jgi:hypothetical protein
MIFLRKNELIPGRIKMIAGAFLWFKRKFYLEINKK